MVGYNRMTGYNKARYNGDGTEVVLADGITVSDSTVTKSTSKLKTELVVMSESIARQHNKSFTETVRLDAWLRDKKKPAGPWSD